MPSLDIIGIFLVAEMPKITDIGWGENRNTNIQDDFSEC